LNSGCDVVVDALQNNGIAMSYAAVEAIWKNAGNLSDMTQVAALFAEATLAQLAKIAPE
jgi:hypothetical protein